MNEHKDAKCLDTNSSRRLRHEVTTETQENKFTLKFWHSEGSACAPLLQRGDRKGELFRMFVGQLAAL